MKIPFRALLPFALPLCFYAQAPQPAFQVSGALLLGIESHVLADGDTLIGIADLSADYRIRNTRVPLIVGLAARCCGNQYSLHGGKYGPRISTSYRTLHPWLEGLFGPQTLQVSSNVPALGQDLQPVNVYGITTQFAVGLDADISPHWRWRVFDFTDGSFSGAPHSRPRSLSFGFVFHAP